MFPNSDIVKSFALGKDKTAYIIKFGIVPYFKKQLVETINNAGPFVLMFDESLNQSSKKTKTDGHTYSFFGGWSGQDILAQNSWDMQELMTYCSTSK